MKIIGKSNFDDESAGDILIATGVSKYFGPFIVSLMNGHICHESATYFYHLVEDDYKLYVPED